MPANPLMIATQITRWTSHLRVPHQARVSFWSRLPKPRRERRGATRANVSPLGAWTRACGSELDVDMCGASFDHTQKDFFQVVLLASERGHRRAFILQHQPQQARLGRLRVGDAD